MALCKTPGTGHWVANRPLSLQEQRCSGSSFSFPGLSHFPSHPVPPAPSWEPRPSQGPDRSPLNAPGTRRQIPLGPRSAKSAQRDGKLQQYWPLGPPPALSRNSRPWTLAPQLIHSWGAGPPPHAWTDVRSSPLVRPRTGQAPKQVARRVSTGPVRPRCRCAASIRFPDRLAKNFGVLRLCPVLH